MSQDSTLVIELRSVRKVFHRQKRNFPAVRGVDLRIFLGEFILILGPSGCGKSTLLHCLLGLERPTNGSVLVDGIDIYQMNADNRALLRRKKFGVVYQQGLFVNFLNVLDNVALPMLIAGVDKALAHKRAKKLLDLVGMRELAQATPTELSGGEQQKVSLARALSMDPDVLVCDEPTGNLDTKSGWEVVHLLESINKEEKCTVIMVTHNMAYWDVGDRKIIMEDGLIKGDYDRGKFGEVKELIIGKV